MFDDGLVSVILASGEDDVISLHTYSHYFWILPRYDNGSTIHLFKLSSRGSKYSSVVELGSGNPFF